MANMSSPLLFAQHLHNAAIAPCVFDSGAIWVIFVLSESCLMSELFSSLVPVSSVLNKMLPLTHLSALATWISAETNGIVANGLGRDGAHAPVRPTVLGRDVRILVLLIRSCAVLRHHIETLLGPRVVSSPFVVGLLVVPISQVQLPVHHVRRAAGDAVKTVQHVN